MKFWIILLLLCSALFVLFYPVVNKERICYETSQKLLDDIATNVLNQRLSRSMECEQSTNALFDLESCIQDATKSGSIAAYTSEPIQRLVSIIRPYNKNLWTLKKEHNLDCTESSTYQLP
jgi:hypothetical protein